MKFTLVNRNHLVPVITTFDNEKSVIIAFIDTVFERSTSYISNVCVVMENDQCIEKIISFDIDCNNYVVISNKGEKIPIELGNYFTRINDVNYLNSQVTILDKRQLTNNANVQTNNVNVQNKEQNKQSENKEILKNIKKYSDIGESFISCSKDNVNISDYTNEIFDVNTIEEKQEKQNSDKKVSFSDKEEIHKIKSEQDKKITILHENTTIKRDGKIIEPNDTKKQNKSDIKLENNSKITIINDNIDINDYKNNNSNIKELNETNKVNEDPINKEINKNNFIKELRSMKENTTIDDKKKQLIKSKLTEFTENYFRQLTENKRMKEKISNLDRKIDKLKVEQDTQVVLNLRKIRDEYLQYKKIKYKDDEYTIEREEELINIPNIFIKKYNFINNACKNEKIKNIFENILKLNVEELFHNLNIDVVSKDILTLSDAYHKMKKDLHTKFSSEYDYLENEMVVNGENTM